MANQWFKFYGSEYLSDRKLLDLDGNERSCLVTLFCYANQDEGNIKFLNEEKLITHSGISVKDVDKYRGIVKKFEQLGIVTIKGDVVTVTNWNKRQRSESYERVKKHREAKKQSSL